MTTPKKTIGSHVISVYSRSPTLSSLSAGSAPAPEAAAVSSLGSVPRPSYPCPPHVDLERVGEVWKVDYEARFRDARRLGARARVRRASERRRSHVPPARGRAEHVLHAGLRALRRRTVGHGRSRRHGRLCSFLYRNLGVVTQAVVTLDTHQAFQIFHAPFLVDADGRHPDPYTLVTLDDVTSGRWRVEPRAAATLGLDETRLGAPAHLCRGARRRGKYDAHDLAVPRAARRDRPRARERGRGGALLPRRSARYSQTRFEMKGRAADRALLGARARGRARRRAASRSGGQHGSRRAPRTFDAVIVAGQAKSHCVAWTVDDLLQDVPEIAPRLYLLEDCSSPSSSRAPSTTRRRPTPHSRASPRPEPTSSAPPSRSRPGPARSRPRSLRDASRAAGSGAYASGRPSPTALAVG